MLTRMINFKVFNTEIKGFDYLIVMPPTLARTGLKNPAWPVAYTP